MDAWSREELFVRHKPTVAERYRKKLPDFVRRLEEELYHSARTKVGTET